MATVILGCDRNNGNDSACQNAVAKALEKAGNTVEKLGIGPNQFASYSYSSKAKGKIGVFLIASGITAIADLYDGNTNFKYAYFGIRGDLKQPRLSTMDEFNKSPIHKDKHGDCISKSCDSLNGKTYPQMNEVTKSKCIAVFGETCEQLGENIVKAMGGETSSSSGSSSASSIKKAIQEVLYGWNGDVECYLRDDTIHINKIRDPTSAKLQLIEDVNVFMEGISITDIDPNTPNKLVVKWHNNKFIIKDDARIKRFGEVSKTIKSSNKTEKDAVAFAYHEWNKLLKDSGRKLECKIDGGPEWRIGEWVRVYIPSFNLNGYMYLTKVNHDDDLDWKVNLTLEDWPPDLGTKPAEKAKTETTSSDSSESTSDSESEGS